MRNARYFIVQDRNQWLIKYNDEEYGPYLTQAEATLFAVDAAQKLSDRGENAAVYLMGENGRVRREWACEEAAERCCARRRTVIVPVQTRESDA